MGHRIAPDQMKKINPNKGIIISYPRNGLNWVRYCIEYFSELPTPGKLKLYKREKGRDRFAVYRTHNVLFPGKRDSCHCVFYNDRGQPVHNKIILLIRDYYESYIRVAKKKMGGTPSPDEIRNGKIFNFRDYFENLKAYDRFSGTKLMIRYTELVKDFSEITTILDFLGISYDLTNFDLEEHRQKSIQIYDTQHKSYSKDNLYNFKFHQEGVDMEVLKALDEFVDANYKDLADRYLR